MCLESELLANGVTKYIVPFTKVHKAQLIFVGLDYFETTPGALQDIVSNNKKMNRCPTWQYYQKTKKEGKEQAGKW